MIYSAATLRRPPYLSDKSRAPRTCTCLLEPASEDSCSGTGSDIEGGWWRDLVGLRRAVERPPARNVGRGRRSRIWSCWCPRCRRDTGPCGLCLQRCLRSALCGRAAWPVGDTEAGCDQAPIAAVSKWRRSCLGRRFVRFHPGRYCYPDKHKSAISQLDSTSYKDFSKRGRSSVGRTIVLDLCLYPSPRGRCCECRTGNSCRPSCRSGSVGSCPWTCRAAGNTAGEDPYHWAYPVWNVHQTSASSQPETGSSALSAACIPNQNQTAAWTQQAVSQCYLGTWTTSHFRTPCRTSDWEHWVHSIYCS